MHRTLPLSGPLCWGPILALFVAITVAVGLVAAQQPQAPPPATGVMVPINMTKVVPLRSKKLITRIQVENPAVVRANPSADLVSESDACAGTSWEQ